MNSLWITEPSRLKGPPLHYSTPDKWMMIIPSASDSTQPSLGSLFYFITLHAAITFSYYLTKISLLQLTHYLLWTNENSCFFSYVVSLHICRGLCLSGLSLEWTGSVLLTFPHFPNLLSLLFCIFKQLYCVFRFWSYSRKPFHIY